MDALDLLKSYWPFGAAAAGGGFAWLKYQDQKKVDAQRAREEAAAEHATTLEVVQRLANDMMDRQHRELEELRADRKSYLERELILLREADQHRNEIEALKRERERADTKIAGLRMEMADLRSRLEERIMQLEGELRQSQQIVESARQTARRQGG